MTEIEFVTPWANKRDNDPLHSLCSYLGAFPPSLANYFINYFTDEGDLVFDPFSGRGTTMLEARILNREAIASDLNPIALALSKAKSHFIDVSEIIERVNELEENYDYPLFLPEAKAQTDDIHLIFHPRTLAQLCYLRLVLVNSKNKVDEFLVGAILGIMHGGERKDGSSGYLSISMPNTFSMSPEYVRRFVQTKQLNREFRDVFQLLREKVIRVFENHTIPNNEAIVVECNAKSVSKDDTLKKYIKKVDLLLTSPPYLGIVNYAKQNWIRSWFLGANPEEVSKRLDDDLNLFEWIKFSKDTLKEFKKFLKPTGVAVLVIGDVAKSKNSLIPLAREFAMMVKENRIFENVWIFSDYIQNTDKTTRIWGDTKGKATTTDRIVILSDINPFENNDRLNGKSVLTYDLIKESTKHFMGDLIDI
ncbi:restriction endonuclease [Elizabethkingia anophelis]|nr:restriction endonuclease [Elizabethkingia anophelis]MDV3862902.1 restriction endonuclease [Elizabethkingia anophelis]MDV3910575.1 restriction endonuclease [Elizabethkingia anophelis]MDV3925380.1 restriction endonuclease [Elizabethkingia anophelis]MDV3990078.1 restriction endonuclease [Elizabethkingia anophelis]